MQKPVIYEDLPRNSREELLARWKAKKARDSADNEKRIANKYIESKPKKREFEEKNYLSKNKETDADWKNVVAVYEKRFRGENGIFCAAELVRSGRTREVHGQLVEDLWADINLTLTEYKASKAGSPEYALLESWAGKLQEEKGKLEFGREAWYDRQQPKKDGKSINVHQDAVERVEQKFAEAWQNVEQEELQFAGFLADGLAVPREDMIPSEKQEEELDQFLTARESGKTASGLPTGASIQEMGRLGFSSEDMRQQLPLLEAEVKRLSEQMEELMHSGQELSSEQHDFLVGWSKKRRELLKLRTELIHQIRLEEGALNGGEENE